MLPSDQRNSGTSAIDIQTSKTALIIDPATAAIDITRTLDIAGGQGDLDRHLHPLRPVRGLQPDRHGRRPTRFSESALSTLYAAQGLYLIQVPLGKTYVEDETLTIELRVTGTENCVADSLGVKSCDIQPGLSYFLDSSLAPFVYDLSPTKSGNDDFDTTLEVTLPEGHVVGATGMLDEVVDNGDGTATHRFSGTHVTVDAFCASTDFVDATRDTGTVPIRAVVRTENETMSEPALDLVENVLAFHTDRLGSLPYESMAFTEIPPEVEVGGIGWATRGLSEWGQD